MYIDSHCHLNGIENRGVNLDVLFSEMAQKEFAFVLDAGTRYNDLSERLVLAERAEKSCGSSHFLFFSAGIWPDADIIPERFTAVAELIGNIKTALEDKKPVVALGECGLDRHWNKDDETLLKGEEELFALQIDAAKKLALPLIIHSRDAFEATISCLKDSAYHRGVIHCFSYGIKEAAVFLDYGWYISLSGSITYMKKNAAAELLRYIPQNRLLLETDAPYLSPVPFRGTPNTPLLIEHTYSFCAQQLGLSLEQLRQTINANARFLFLSSSLQ